MCHSNNRYFHFLSQCSFWSSFCLHSLPPYNIQNMNKLCATRWGDIFILILYKLLKVRKFQKMFHSWSSLCCMKKMIISTVLKCNFEQVRKLTLGNIVMLRIDTYLFFYALGLSLLRMCSLRRESLISWGCFIKYSLVINKRPPHFLYFWKFYPSPPRTLF